MGWVEAITAFVGSYPHLAYGAVMLLALSESLPLLGAVIPGTAIIVGLSVLVPSGVLKLSPLLAAATVGAIIGDGFSFWLGYRYHRDIAARWPFNRYPALIERSEAFFRHHGGKSVFLARFLPGVRAFVPLVAGMLRMQAGRFYVVNILSAAIWAPAHILPGVFAGAFAASAGPAGRRLAVLALLAVLAIWAALRLVRYVLRRAAPLLELAIDRLRDWAGRHDNLLSSFVLMLVSPAKSEPPVLFLLVCIFLGAAWLFFGLTEDVLSGDPLVGFDQAVFQFFQSLRTVSVDTVMIGITELGDTTVVLLVSACVLGWLLLRGSWRTAGYFLAAVAAGSLFNTLIKVAIHRTRPSPDLYAGWSDFSFPSGHSTVNAALYGFVAFLACRRLSMAGRMAIALPVAVFVLAIAASRVYLGAHWFSDVSAGLTFAALWLTVLMIAYLNHRASDEPTRGILAMTGVALFLAGGANIWLHHAADTTRYAARSQLQIISEQDWRNDAWQWLPAARVDVTGEREESFVLQWAGDLPALEGRLSAKGWHRPVPWTLASGLSWLNIQADIKSLPSLPRLDRGALPSLVLVREQPGQTTRRLVLSAWRADADIVNGKTRPLWLVSVVEERSKAIAFGMGYLAANDGSDVAPEMLKDNLQDVRAEEKHIVLPAENSAGSIILAQDAD